MTGRHTEWMPLESESGVLKTKRLKEASPPAPQRHAFLRGLVVDETDQTVKENMIFKIGVFLYREVRLMILKNGLTFISEIRPK